MSFFALMRGGNRRPPQRRKLMDEKIITTYGLCDDLLHAMHHQEDPQCQMSDAEVLTTAFTAAFFFRGNLESARWMLKQHDYMPQMLSKSRLNRDSIYVIDSLPIAVCDNIRIKHSKLYTDEQFRGYIASKKRYFYGLKIHLMVTKDGQPVEFFLTHGGCGDVDALKYYTFDVPEESLIYADKAYNDYEIEDLLKEVDHIHLLPMRKKNSKRAYPQCVSFVQHYYRKRIETAGSLIEQRLPKSIHAVTSQGFELKVALFVVAYSLNCYIDL